MAEKSFLKLYCPVKRLYYGATLEKVGSRWEVCDFIPLTEAQAKPVASLVEQTYFDTKKNLLPCQYENTRRICSSSLVKCPSSNKYNYQCIYCKKMQISYDSDLSGTSLKEGETLKLAQGQEVKIAFGGKNIDKIEVNVGWDPAISGSNMDIDSSVILYNAQSRDDYELVYYCNTTDDNDTVYHHGDDVVGDSSDDVDEIIDVNLKEIAYHYDHIAVVVNIFNADSKGQDFGQVRNLFMRILDANTRKSICDYQVSHNIRNQHGIILGLFSKSGTGWKFKAIGDASRPDCVESYAEDIIKRYK